MLYVWECCFVLVAAHLLCFEHPLFVLMVCASWKLMLCNFGNDAMYLWRTMMSYNPLSDIDAVYRVVADAVYWL